MTAATPASDEATQRPQIPLLLGAVFLAYLGQMTLNPIIAPLSREVGLAEWQVGVTISAAAVMVVLSSQFWGAARCPGVANRCSSPPSRSRRSRWPPSPRRPGWG